MHGKGFLRFPDEACYNGEWRNGTMHGWGIFKHADGSTQVGGEEYRNITNKTISNPLPKSME